MILCYLQHFVMLTVLALVWAAVTNCHRLSDLNNTHLFLTVLEAQKSKIKASKVSGEATLSNVQRPKFSLCPHKMENREVPCLLPLL